jgi:hypothetical protein
VELVGHLLAQGEQAGALRQALLQLGIDGGRGRPALRPEEGGELGQGLGVSG